MLCPLRFTAGAINHNDEAGGTDCLKEQCAWWIAIESLCSITTLATTLHQATYGLASIATHKFP